LQNVVETALREKAGVLAAVGESAESVVVADAVLARANDATDGNRRIRLAKSLVVKGTALLADGRLEEALAPFDEVIMDFAGVDEPAIRWAVTQALNGKATALEALGRDEESSAVFREMSDRFGNEALALFDGIVDSFANSSDSQHREGAAHALLSKATALDNLGRKRDAHTALTELITRFTDDMSGGIPLLVAEAHEAREKLDVNGGPGADS
jgi:tetratricopeptide (TPR) repeat protein